MTDTGMRNLTSDEFEAWLDRHGCGEDRRMAGPVTLRHVAEAPSMGSSTPMVVAQVEVVSRGPSGDILVDRAKGRVVTEVRTIPCDFMPE